MCENSADAVPPANIDSVHDLRFPVAASQIDIAVYRCRTTVRSFLLPDQRQVQIAFANRLANRIADGDDSAAAYYDCDGDERAFIAYWGGPAEDRLNGTQQLALGFYRGGRYASARLASEVIGVDGGLPWSLIRHLRATTCPDDAYRQVSRTFERLCELGQCMRDSLNAALTADQTGPAIQNESGASRSPSVGSDLA